ncbi:lipopolysaccharide heptosyltransferase family protein [Thalassospira marina]|uniref:Heptosyltransferase n=1 Tax=Thalassospira marina TaxID=2048283 RepID=A0A2N3KVQ5_9PROT|nr:lipopolysaccharide heptosyltransferase family protein [Thalassospira marina]PKR54655.1 heptosyltransferase [Thalassospira marina]
MASSNVHLSRARFTRFKTRQPFEFGLPNVAAGISQKSDGSASYLTRVSSLLRQQVLPRAASVKIVSDEIHLDVLPKPQWTRSFDRKRVLFLIPADALGDCVGMTMFLRAFLAAYPHCKIGLLNTGSASDIFAGLKNTEIFQLFISANALKRFDFIIDLSEMDGWKDIATAPVDCEGVLCREFDVPPVPLPHKDVAKGNMLQIGILPMASSPLRTLPPEFVAKSIHALRDSAGATAKITIILNAYQGVKEAYKTALGEDIAQDDHIELVDGFKTIAELVSFIGNCDYVLVADSGPAHITKLAGIPGIGIYSSASSEVLHGRFRNIKAWQSDFRGEYCAAPCGLAKMHATEDGKIGCMGSLAVTKDKLVALPNRRDPALVQRTSTTDPVPCVKHLLTEFDRFETFLHADFKKQITKA